MESPKQLANGTVNFLNGVADISQEFDQYLRRVIYEVLEKFSQEQDSRPSLQRPPLVLEIKGIRFSFDPKIFTTGKIYISSDSENEILAQCPEGYHLVIKNGFAYCELNDDLKKKYYG